MSYRVTLSSNSLVMSSTPCFASRVACTSAIVLETSDIFALRARLVVISYIVAFWCMLLSSSRIACPCDLTVSQTALKVSLTMSWMFFHSLLPWSRSYTNEGAYGSACIWSVFGFKFSMPWVDWAVWPKGVALPLLAFELETYVCCWVLCCKY